MDILTRPVHLILDWDGTLTTKDTLAVLAELPKTRDERNHNSGNSGTAPVVSSVQWQDIVNGYMQACNAHQASHFPSAGGPEALEKWLDSLESIEYASAQRASDSGFFKGVSSEDVRPTITRALETRALELRHGWEKLLSLGLATGCQVTIVSVNWSETFIRWSLYLAAARLQRADLDTDELQSYINNMHIYANDIHGLSSPLGSSGRLVGNVRTAQEKLACMKKAVAAHAPSIEPERAPAVVYVGDSATDFLCLQRASGSGRGCDRGVWIFDGPAGDAEKTMEKTFAPCKAEELDFVVARDLERVYEIVLEVCGDETHRWTARY
ncbi:hypothetical protein Tdes44962_MAKER07337 [Teratosphaeria destructans]|uniref:Haloacid dehalogenase-like hydrolase n=1 Tax=Teratosphaeria destructans TaxID=418781 RepID=A0A9W7SZL7_9PEZI|nr:hypothetical protein Tdes44962_MAKER07337 [Teratosphaeria destructans]